MEPETLMQTYKYISMTDLLFSGSMFLVSLACSIGAIATPQDWNTGKIVVLSCAVLGFAGGLALFLRKLVWGKPTYITKQAAAVWVGSTSISQILCERAIDHYIFCMLELTGLSKEGLREIMTKMSIIFSRDPVSSIGKGYSLGSKAGLAAGYKIAVQLESNKITGSTFFHELGHVSSETILGRQRDYEHTEKPWWDIHAQVESRWEE